MSGKIRLTCLLILALVLVACGSSARAGQQTPSVTIQTAPPIATATTQPTEPPPTETVPPTPLPEVRVTRAVNLRTGPSTDFAIIRTLPAGTLIKLVSRSDENGERWYQVRVGEDEGWVSGQIVQVDAAQASALPAN